MSDFLAALGLLLVIEGVAYSLFPAAMRAVASRLQTTPETHLRGVGLLAAVAGVAMVFLVRG